MSRSTRYTEGQFRKAVAENFSMRALLMSLSLVPAGGNYAEARKKIRLLGLSTEHWLGQAIHRGKMFGPKPRVTLDEALCENSTYNRGCLKTRLVREGLLPYNCQVCGVADWLGQKLTLHLDHSNGVNNDNRLENLRLLCPNCHSQTSTYTGRNIQKRAKQKLCVDCLAAIHADSTRCAPCATANRRRKAPVPRPTKIKWPDSPTLVTMVSTYPLTHLAKQLGVSDNAIRKHCKKLGICVPSRTRTETSV